MVSYQRTEEHIIITIMTTSILIKGFRTETNNQMDMLTKLGGGTTRKSMSILMGKRGRFGVLLA